MEFPSVCPARWLPDHNFAMCMMPHDFLSSFQDMQSSYYRPWKWYNQTTSKEFGSTVENEKGNYKITLDVQYFRPNEINVKVTNYEIIVEGKHEERQDIHGFVTRQFKRRYPLPGHCLPENVTSTLSSDGVLTIIAEKKASMSQDEKIVPIKLSGTFPRKAQIDTNITSEITQKSLQQARKIENEETKEDHSRLLKPELLKDITSDSNGTSVKSGTEQSIGIMKASEKMEELNISSNLNKIEESIGNSIVGLVALKEQFDQNSSTSNTEMGNMKISSEISNIKSTSEKLSLKNPPGTSGTQKTTSLSDVENILDVSDKKSTSDGFGMKKVSEMSGMRKLSEISGAHTAHETLGTKSVSKQSGMTKSSGMSDVKSMTEMKISASETCGARGMSKTLVEESVSSCTSSSSMSSSKTVSGNAREFIIREELREAAENI